MSKPVLAEMSLSTFSQNLITVSIISITTFVGGGLLALAAWRLWLHPCAAIPGPFLGRLTPLYMYYMSYRGLEGSLLRDLHARFDSKVIRVSPNSVSISDISAIREIYVRGGGFMKDRRYSNFNLGPIMSIFSSLDNEYRDKRAKAVAPLFAPVRLRTACRAGGVISKHIDEYIQQLKDQKAAALRTDILDMSARLAMDATTSYLFGRPYGGLSENSHLALKDRHQLPFSANPFIASIVRFGRFSLFPNWLFRLLYTVSSRFHSGEEVNKGAMLLDEYVQQRMDAILSAPEEEMNNMYHARLINVGILPVEAHAQVKAAMFAGADSIAVMLATILFHLVRNHSVRGRLLSELQDERSLEQGDIERPRPYLQAVIKEGLRLGLTNPTRMTRVVPSSGLQLRNTFLPPGTVVGCSPAVLHHDPEVFPDSLAFKPERWLEAEDSNDLKRPNMERSMLPYGLGLRACIGKNLAQSLLHEAVAATIRSQVLEGAETCQDKIELIEWFNAEIKGHRLEVQWL